MLVWMCTSGAKVWCPTTRQLDGLQAQRAAERAHPRGAPQQQGRQVLNEPPRADDDYFSGIASNNRTQDTAGTSIMSGDVLSEWQSANYDSSGFPAEIQAVLATQNPELVSEIGKIVPRTRPSNRQGLLRRRLSRATPRRARPRG